MPRIPSRPPSSRTLLQELVAGLTEGVILVEADGAIAWANPVALALHGVRNPEDLGGNAAGYYKRFQLRYRNRRKLARSAYPIARMQAGETLRETVVEVLPRGSDEPLSVLRLHSLPIAEDGGACHVLIMQDVTERYAAETRFERTFAANPAPALIARQADQRIVKVNPGFLEMARYGRDALVGQELRRLGGQPFQHEGLALHEAMRAGRPVPQTEVLLRTGDDDTKLAIAAGQPIEVDDTACMLFTFADLDTRRRAEEALRHSEELFSKAFRLAPVPMLVAAQDDGRVLNANEAFLQVRGLPLDQALGRTPAQLGLWRRPADLQAFERKLRRTGSVRDTDTQVRLKDDEVIDCLVSAERVRIGGRPCALIAMQDITERKRTETELVAAIEAVMQDTSWFSQTVIEKLAHMRQSGGAHANRAAIADLTVREREVLGALCQGASDADIAQQLGISRNTVRNHVSTIYEKIGVNRRSAAVVWARERGFTGARPARR